MFCKCACVAFVQNGKAVKRRLSFVYFFITQILCICVYAVIVQHSTAFAPLTEYFYAHEQLFNLNTVHYQKWAIASYTHLANSIDDESRTKNALSNTRKSMAMLVHKRIQNGQPKRHKHLSIWKASGNKGKQKKATSNEIYKRKMRDTFSRRHHKKWLWLSDRYFRACVCWCRYTYESSS